MGSGPLLNLVLQHSVKAETDDASEIDSQFGYNDLEQLH